MSTGVKRSAPQVPGGGGSNSKMKTTNGTAPAPLTYSSGEPTDDVNMNEVDEKVTLEVTLPNSTVSQITVDSW